MNPFSIMVDTGCDLPDEYIDAHGIKTIPISFNLDGVQHSSGRWQEISAVAFYTALANGSMAGTALINPETYVDVFTEYAERGEELLVITLSSGLSGTFQNSRIALDEVKRKYPDCKIFTVDSANACGGIGLLTTLAVKKRDEGLGLAETVTWLDEKKQSCISLFTVDDLMFLHRGGRLGKVSAVAGRIIGIKPLLNVAPDGTLKLKDKARGRNGALERLVGQMKRSLNNGTKLDTVIICHSNCEEDARKVATLVKSAVSVREVVITMMGPVIGAHTGPGTIAMFFEADMSRIEYERKFYSK
ncbi:MAG: DegV family protein [Oscillospiraceae bacterium]|nr:DegV family protein [Oscillospiraceae bacterium]